jgi:hypothetical protein
MYCQCEHIRHDHAEHWNIVQPVAPVKTIYGTFQLCEDCIKSCYDKEDLADFDNYVTEVHDQLDLLKFGDTINAYQAPTEATATLMARIIAVGWDQKLLAPVVAKLIIESFTAVADRLFTKH